MPKPPDSKQLNKSQQARRICLKPKHQKTGSFGPRPESALQARGRWFDPVTAHHSDQELETAGIALRVTRLIPRTGFNRQSRILRKSTIGRGQLAEVEHLPTVRANHLGMHTVQTKANGTWHSDFPLVVPASSEWRSIQRPSPWGATRHQAAGTGWHYLRRVCREWPCRFVAPRCYRRGS
jgi:hypothetical protein